MKIVEPLRPFYLGERKMADITGPAMDQRGRGTPSKRSSVKEVVGAIKEGFKNIPVVKMADFDPLDTFLDKAGKMSKETSKTAEKTNKETEKTSSFFVMSVKEAASEVKTSFVDAGKAFISTLGSHITDILGPIHTELIMPIWNTFKSFGGIFKKIFFNTKDKMQQIAQEQLVEQEKTNELLAKNVSSGKTATGEADDDRDKQTGLLGKMFSLFKRGEKRAARDGKDKKGGGGIFGMLGAAFTGLVSVIPAIGAAFSSLLTAAGPFLTALGIIYAAVMGIIGFVEGFTSTEGSMGDKIIGGLKKAIEKILYFPVQIIGWVGEKLFGLEEGLGDRLMGRIMPVIEGIIDVIGVVIDPVIEYLKVFWEGIKSLFSVIGDAFSLMGNIIDGIMSLFSGDTKGFKESMVKAWDDVKSLFTNIIDVILTPIKAIFAFFKTLLLESGKKLIGKVKGWFGFGDDESGGMITGPDAKGFNRVDLDLPMEGIVGYKTMTGEAPMAPQMPPNSKGWVLPMGQERVTSQFGMRRHPTSGGRRMHKGTDLAGPQPGMYGYPILAAKTGVVTVARSLRGYGNAVYIEHPDGWQTRYAHLQGFNVQEGQQVVAGQQIGGMGNTGVGTGPHLHFETRKDGKPYDPMQVLSARMGAMITSQASEFGIPANVHPNEAILPLNDKVMGALGEKIGKNVPDSSGAISTADAAIRRATSSMQNKQLNASQTLSNIMEKSMGDLRKTLGTQSEGMANVINSVVSGGQKSDIPEPPDMIENAFMILQNSAWGIG